MDLRTGTSIWQLLDGPPPPVAPLARHESCDIAIIGAGISGAMIALRLARAGLDVVVLDRRDPTAGSTLACTALIQYEIDQPLTRLRQLIGQPQADQAYRACYQALTDIPAFTATLPDPADLTARPSLYLAGDDMGPHELRREAGARQQLGIDARFLDASALEARFGIRRPGAIQSAAAFDVDPVRLAAACLADATQRGARVYGCTEIIRHDADAKGVTLHTATGQRIRCRQVVYAPGYEAPEFLGVRIGTLGSSYALATTPNPSNPAPWPESALIWEASSPYFYARTTPDGRIIAGGEDEPFTDPAARDRLIPAKVQAIRAKLGALFPHLQLEVETAWTGTFAETPDGLPRVGSIARLPRALLALGYGGNGVLFSFLAAQLIRDLILGNPNPIGPLLSFDRPVL